MADFDPENYIKGKLAEDAKFDPENYIKQQLGASQPPVPTEQPKEDISQWQSLLGGLEQGGTFGTADEISGGLDAAAQSVGRSVGLLKDNGKSFGENYKKARDESRAKFAAEHEANPWTYNTGDIAGSIGSGMLGGSVLGLGGAAAGAAEGLGGAALESAPSLLNIAGTGAIEGAAHGMGRSDADTANGVAADTLKGAAIGGIAAPLVKVGIDNVGAPLLKGSVNIAKKVPVLGDIIDHLQNVARYGAEAPNSSFKSGAMDSLDELQGQVAPIKDQAIKIFQKSDELLDAAKATANAGLKQNNDKLFIDLGANRTKLGKYIGNIYDKIGEFVDDNFRLTPKALGQTFDDLVEGIPQAEGKLQLFKNTFASNPTPAGAKAALETMDHWMQSPAYMALDPSAKAGVMALRQEFTSGINDSLREVVQHIPEAEGLLNRLDVANGRFHDVATAMDGMYGDTAPIIKGSTKIITNSGTEKNLDKLRYSQVRPDLSPEPVTGSQPDRVAEMLNLAKQSGDERVQNSVDDLVGATTENRRLNIDNPVLGKMGLGPVEEQAAQFKQLFGIPNEFGATPKELSETIASLSGNPKNTTDLERRSGFVDWIQKTYGEKAPEVMQQLTDASKKFNTLKAGLGKNSQLGQDESSWIRLSKKAADPVAYTAGRYSSLFNNLGTNSATVTRRTGLPLTDFSHPNASFNNLLTLGKSEERHDLTKPQDSQSIINNFKDSQSGNRTPSSPSDLQENPGMNRGPASLNDTQKVLDEVNSKYPLLGAIAQVESGGGRNLNHAMITNPNSMHYGMKAGGIFGMMPNTAAELVKNDSDLAEKYPELADVADDVDTKHTIFTDFLNKNPQAAADFAEALFEKNSNGTHNDQQLAYSWLNGLNAAKNADAKKIARNPYVKKVFNKLQEFSNR